MFGETPYTLLYVPVSVRGNLYLYWWVSEILRFLGCWLHVRSGHVELETNAYFSENNIVELYISNGKTNVLWSKLYISNTWLCGNKIFLEILFFCAYFLRPHFTVLWWPFSTHHHGQTLVLVLWYDKGYLFMRYLSFGQWKMSIIKINR